jgi:membrane-bound lytic murein transglycosylase D
LLASEENKPAPEPTVAQTDSKAAADTAKKTIYVVKKGDNLRQIAQAYQVTVEELKEWNNLRTSTILPSQKLTVMRFEPVLANKPSEDAPAGELAQESSPAEAPVALASATSTPVEVSPRSTAPEQNKKPTPVKKPVQKVQKIHSVQPGDTLWNISRRYDGLTVEQLRKVNKLKSDALKPGQKLVISTSS